MSGPRWVFNGRPSNSLFGPGATGRGSGLFGDPGLAVPDASFARISLSHNSEGHVSTKGPQTDDENEIEIDSTKKEIFKG